MGKVAVVRHREAEISLSMVRWGLTRRLALFWGRKLRIVSRFRIAVFIPKYEIAVYEGGPKAVFRQKPIYIFYYPNAIIALKKWDELASILEREGIFGTADFIRAAHPREQGLLDNLNFHERLIDLFQ